MNWDIVAAVLVVIIAAMCSYLSGYDNGYRDATQRLSAGLRKIKDDEARKNIVEDMCS